MEELSRLPEPVRRLALDRFHLLQPHLEEGRPLRPKEIEALSVAAYIEQLGGTASKPTVKQHLAAIRQLFDYLTTGGVLEVNPAASVRGPKYVVRRGKTPVLSSEEARKLLDSIESNTLIGLRDRALVGSRPSHSNSDIGKGQSWGIVDSRQDK
jgi:site-specific recombinase XerD